jgi:hypothetical protein
MAVTYEQYMDAHPWREVWDQDKWPERSVAIDTRFRQENIYFTPIVGGGVVMPPGVGWDDPWYKGAEIIPSHINHNEIGRYQRMMDAIYIDSQQKKLYSRNRYGTKIQWDRRDTMVTRYGGDSDSFLAAALMGQFGNQIVGIHERGCRDAILEFSIHKFIAPNGAKFEIGTADFSNIERSSSYAFDIRWLDDSASRMSYRSRNQTAHSDTGLYNDPVPGNNFADSFLVHTTTPVMKSLWENDENSWLTPLLALQDQRVINGGEASWRNRGVVADTGYQLVLWNAGNLTKQVAVTSPIKWGDGAPDPEVDAAVDGVYYPGQSSAGITHYIQCSAFAASEFVAGDVISIHVKRQGTGAGEINYGITDGVDFLDGKTVTMEIYEVDAVNNRLVFRQPMTEEFVDAFSYASLNGSSATGNAYAFITSAQHIHPVYVYAATNPVMYVSRLQPDGSHIEYHQPSDDNVDFPSVVRFTANWYAEFNQWAPQLTEIIFCAAPFANTGAAAY